MMAKPEAKEKASAQYPTAEGSTPAPNKNPMKMIRETATPRTRSGKRRETMVKPVGNRQMPKPAWRKIRMETGVVPGMIPSKTVKRPVVIMKMVRARMGPIRSIIIPEINSTTIPRLREKPIRVLAQGRSIPISLTRKRGMTA